MPPPALGTIAPSSNRVVERTLAAVLPLFPALDSCVARIPYHGAGLGQPADRYDEASFVAAASLLAHAGVLVLCWNGTRGAALGLEQDEALCAAMTAATGCPATSTALAARALLDRMGARRVGIVAQGSAADGARALAGLGREAAGIRGLELTDNAAAAAVPPARLAELAKEIAAEARPEAILLWSTNLHGVGVMAPVEAACGVPVLDSACIGIRGCLDALGIDPAPAAALGRMFSPGA